MDQIREQQIKLVNNKQRELKAFKELVAEREFLATRTSRLSELWHQELQNKKDRIVQLEQESEQIGATINPTPMDFTFSSNVLK